MGATATPTLSRRLADFAVGLDPAEVPEAVLDAARLHALDLVGVALAAYGMGAGDCAARSATALGGAGPASVIGAEAQAPASVAALANGTLAHSLEFDDTHTASISHASAVVVPAALAVAEAEGRSGRELLTAIVVGIEVVARLGIDAAPAYMRTGFHPTSVGGVFGAAAAAARLRGLDRQQTAHALGIAGSFASGIFEYLGDGATTKAVHAGWAAHGGIVAATLAEAGGEGPAEVLEGRFGVFATHHRFEDRSELGADWALGTRWETAAMSFKPYPACHFVAGALDAARALRERGLDPATVDSITVAVPAPALPIVLEPREHKIRPRTPFEAKFSLQYSLAAMLVNGSVGVETYAPERLADEQVLGLAARVEHLVESFPGYPEVLPARVTVRLVDGSEASELSPPGSVPPPFPPAQVRRKFRANAALALAAADVAQLERSLLAVDELGDVRDALAPLRRAQRASHSPSSQRNEDPGPSSPSAT